MHGVLNEVYLRNLSHGMSVTFRDESNEPSSTIIGYSDATVTAPRSSSNHAAKDLISYSTCYSTIIVKIVLKLGFI